jgi:3-hydroxypropanoate dehydrogenase
MSAQVIQLRDADPAEDGAALLAAVSELHALITLDPVLGASPVRVCFVFNPEARQRIAASLDPTDGAGRRGAPTYALVCYDFPFALQLLRASASRLAEARAKEIVVCSAGLQAEALRVAAATLGIDARPVPAFDAGGLKATFLPNTQETVIQLFALRRRA